MHEDGYVKARGNISRTGKFYLIIIILHHFN